MSGSAGKPAGMIWEAVERTREIESVSVCAGCGVFSGLLRRAAPIQPGSVVPVESGGSHAGKINKHGRPPAVRHASDEGATRLQVGLSRLWPALLAVRHLPATQATICIVRAAHPSTRLGCFCEGWKSGLHPDLHPGSCPYQSIPQGHA